MNMLLNLIRNKKQYLFITCSFLIIIFWFSFSNYHIYSSDLIDFISSNITIRKLNEEITQALKSDDLFYKDNFINLSGIYGRFTARRKYNQVILLKNGMLISQGTTITKTEDKMKSLLDFSDFVSERGGHYIYAQCPYKNDFYETLLPDGMPRTYVSQLEKMLGTFRNGGVDIIDLQYDFTATQEIFEENFYRTDLHWKPSSAFRAFGIIMDRIKEIYPDEYFPEYVTDIDNWTIHSLPNHFLGAWGRRVGLYFAGLDALEWLTPHFDADFSLFIPNKQRFEKGNYETIFIEPKYMKTGGDKFHTGHYAIYLGGGYPLVRTWNPTAYSDLKLLIIKDSFAVPMQSFFPFYFKEVHTIDPRTYTTTSIKEYVDWYRPDIVLSIFNGRATGMTEYYTFSSNDDLFIKNEGELLLDKTATVAKKESKNNYISIYKKFENEKVYSLKSSDIQVSSGKADSISITLYDKKTKKNIQQSAFDISYCNQFKNCEWIFKTPESGSKNLELRVYAGFLGKTTNNEVNFENLKLYLYE